MRQTLRQIGAAVGVQVEVSADDRAGFDRLLDVPLRTLAAEFRSEAALRAFVLRKLEQAHDREHIRRIAAIFEAA